MSFKPIHHSPLPRHQPTSFGTTPPLPCAPREAQNGHRGAIIWFAGLSGSGKSRLSHAVEESLHQRGCRTFVLDGDNVRHGLCGDLGFSAQDRQENIRRIGEVAKLFMEAGVIVLTAFVSPYRADRERVRGMVEHGDFIEIYCDTPIEICETRDVKGLYKKPALERSPNLPASHHPTKCRKTTSLPRIQEQHLWIPVCRR